MTNWRPAIIETQLIDGSTYASSDATINVYIVKGPHYLLHCSYKVRIVLLLYIIKNAHIFAALMLGREQYRCTAICAVASVIHSTDIMTTTDQKLVRTRGSGSKL